MLCRVNFLRKGLNSAADRTACTVMDNWPRDPDFMEGAAATCDETYGTDVAMQCDTVACNQGCDDTAVARACEDAQRPAGPAIGSDEPAGPGMQVCTECGARIPSGNVQEHSDMHMAQRISATVNGASYIEPKFVHSRDGSQTTTEVRFEEAGARSCGQQEEEAEGSAIWHSWCPRPAPDEDVMMTLADELRTVVTRIVL
jgi:Ubiquitin-Binding Zinc Finger